MRRDLDLVRAILIAIENSDHVPLGWVDIDVRGHDPDTISYHLAIMNEGGLIEAKDLSSDDGYEWKPVRLTWAGHEFLANAKDEGIWSTTKKLAGEGLKSISFGVFQDLLAAVVRQHLGLAA